MAKVYLSLGSNIEPKQHIKSAICALRQQFGNLVISPIYESESVGFKGDNFLNLVVGIKTDKSVGELNRQLKIIEDKNGRCRQSPKFSGRTLDIDILTYDAAIGELEGVALPRDEILHNAFVLLPLQDVAKDELHPSEKLTYGELWEKFNQASQKLWRVEL